MINQHKYGTPEWMVTRITEWIGQNGGEDSTSLTMYEAQQTIKRMQNREKSLETALQHCLNWLPTDCAAAGEAAALLEKT